jgi:hypothetical protein
LDSMLNVRLSISVNRNEGIAAAVAAVRGLITASTKATRMKHATFSKLFNVFCKITLYFCQ